MSKTNSLIMAKRLKELREEHELSHVLLSKALKEKYDIDISRDSLMSYEVSDPYHTKAYKNEGMRVEYLRCLADFYGVSSDYLLGLTNDPAKKPSAVDELGLSPAIIQNIKRLKEDSEEEFNDSISELGEGDQMVNFNSCRLSHGAFNQFISATLEDSIIYAQISLLARRIEMLSAAEIPEHLTAHEILNKRLGGVATDISAGVKLSFELYEKYPELAGLFQVQFGGKSLKIDIDDICYTLRTLIEEITGYRAFIESQKPKGVNSRGND